ncbi:regulating synaptic membrane exocytosis protein 4 [Echinops telfairi]|uniref:Regulating synaptic membrane exocytosis protein 4 n=1 Tax=Echinops telfairi TaxID=9371 RepID=A0ABM1VLF8_ECHTE|nr:regulating synaptic membrane exocytosis protein 4 [Echinops telfairi]
MDEGSLVVQRVKRAFELVPPDSDPYFILNAGQLEWRAERILIPELEFQFDGLLKQTSASRQLLFHPRVSVGAMCRSHRHRRATCSHVGSWLEADGRRLKGAIQRSTETGLAVEMPSRTLRQASHESIEDSMNSYGSESNLNYGGVCLASDAQFSDFLGSMGPAQFVGRQTLATTPMGDVEIGLQERNGQLEVDIIQARGLTAKPGSKTLPAAYIKAYLLENGICIAKKKTKVARKSLDPLYNQVLLFPESPQGKVLQRFPMGTKVGLCLLVASTNVPKRRAAPPPLPPSASPPCLGTPESRGPSLA